MTNRLATNYPINKELLIETFKKQEDFTFVGSEKNNFKFNIQLQLKLKGVKSLISIHLSFNEVLENALALEEIQVQNKKELGIGAVRQATIETMVTNVFDKSLFSKNPTTDNEIEEILVKHKGFDSNPGYERVYHPTVIRSVRSDDLELLFTLRAKYSFHEDENNQSYYLAKGLVCVSSDYRIGDDGLYLKDENENYYKVKMEYEEGTAIKCFVFVRGNWTIDFTDYYNLLSYSQLLPFLSLNKETKEIKKGEDGEVGYKQLVIHSEKMFLQPEEAKFEVGQLVTKNGEIYAVKELISESKGLYRLTHESSSFEIESEHDNQTETAHVNLLKPYVQEDSTSNVGKFVYVKPESKVMRIVEEHPNYYLFDFKSRFNKALDHRFSYRKEDCLFPYAKEGIDAQSVMKESLSIDLIKFVYSHDSKEHFALGLYLEQIFKEVRGDVLRYTIYNLLSQDNSPKVALVLLNELYRLMFNNNQKYIWISQKEFFSSFDGELLPKVFEC